MSGKSIWLSTVLIGIVDGFNPCSLWVLTMLLAMIVRTNSRKKTLIIGIVFLTVTAAIYALFIGGVFTVLSYVSFMKWIQIAVAVLTLVMGLINFKDYFFFKEGVSNAGRTSGRTTVRKTVAESAPRSVAASSMEGSIWRSEAISPSTPTGSSRTT